MTDTNHHRWHYEIDDSEDDCELPEQLEDELEYGCPVGTNDPNWPYEVQR